MILAVTGPAGVLLWLRLPAFPFPMNSALLNSEQVRTRIAELGPWFHNMTLGGVETAPNHFLGDYPAVKWSRFKNAIPADLRGWSVLDVGCNGGFYSIEMKRRGANRVVGIDSDEVYLAQARFAAEVLSMDIEFRNMSVYEIGKLGEQFDLVIYMGVFYHLRHPLLALDLLRQYAVRNLLLFQSMLRGPSSVAPLKYDYPFEETEIFETAGYPVMHFVENRYCNDPTNWWIPNTACAEALLRSSGFEILSHPEAEVYLCRPSGVAAPLPEVSWSKP